MIYQTRKNVNRRQVLNEDEIIKYLIIYSKKNNLTFVNFVHSDFDFEKRFSLYFNSKIIIAPHGAASYHMFACKENTIFIEFVVEGSCGLFAPALVDYHMLFAENVNSKNDWHKDYEINLEKLQRILEENNKIELYENN